MKRTFDITAFGSPKDFACLEFLMQEVPKLHKHKIDKVVRYMHRVNSQASEFKDALKSDYLLKLILKDYKNRLTEIQAYGLPIGIVSRLDNYTKAKFKSVRNEYVD